MPHHDVDGPEGRERVHVLEAANDALIQRSGKIAAARKRNWAMAIVCAITALIITGLVQEFGWKNATIIVAVITLVWYVLHLEGKPQRVLFEYKRLTTELQHAKHTAKQARAEGWPAPLRLEADQAVERIQDELTALERG